MAMATTTPPNDQNYLNIVSSYCVSPFTLLVIRLLFLAYVLFISIWSIFESEWKYLIKLTNWSLTATLIYFIIVSIGMYQAYRLEQFVSHFYAIKHISSKYDPSVSDTYKPTPSQSHITKLRFIIL